MKNVNEDDIRSMVMDSVTRVLEYEDLPDNGRRPRVSSVPSPFKDDFYRQVDTRNERKPKPAYRPLFKDLPDNPFGKKEGKPVNPFRDAVDSEGNNTDPNTDYYGRRITYCDTEVVVIPDPVSKIVRVERGVGCMARVHTPMYQKNEKTLIYNPARGGWFDFTGKESRGPRVHTVAAAQAIASAVSDMNPGADGPFKSPEQYLFPGIERPKPVRRGRPRKQRVVESEDEVNEGRFAKLAGGIGLAAATMMSLPSYEKTEPNATVIDYTPGKPMYNDTEEWTDKDGVWHCIKTDGSTVVAKSGLKFDFLDGYTVASSTVLNKRGYMAEQIVRANASDGRYCYIDKFYYTEVSGSEAMGEDVKYLLSVKEGDRDGYTIVKINPSVTGVPKGDDVNPEMYDPDFVVGSVAEYASGGKLIDKKDITYGEWVARGGMEYFTDGVPSQILSHFTECFDYYW